MHVLTSNDLSDYIMQHDLQAEIVRMGVEAPTVESAAEALGVTVDEIIKSLVFEAGGELVLVVAGGSTPVQAGRLAAHLGVSETMIALASPERVQQATGYPVGGVPPFGHASRLVTIMDSGVLRHEWVWGGGGEVRALLKVRPDTILRVCQADVVDLQIRLDGQIG